MSIYFPERFFSHICYDITMTQAHALNILKMGHSAFLTGGAGSGKTYVLNAYIKHLKEHGVEVAVTASTGIAATHIGGMTIHAWSGLGIKQTISDYELDQLEEKKYLWDRYQKVQVLIIDEISMLSGVFLDTLDKTCRAMKRCVDKPFGGMQVVLCGDLFQLPPISQESSQSSITNSSAWKNLNPIICYLSEQHRQDDELFTEILNAIRKNNLDEVHFEQLESRITEFDDESFMSKTKLFTHNADVDAINQRALEFIGEESYEYTMTSKGKDRLIETLKKSCLAPERLILKKGAEVMFVKNSFESGYVNGTRGIVVDFDDNDEPVIETREGKLIHVGTESWSIDDNGKVLASITQLPLRHAWAITVHKSQGMSLDEAVIDLSKAFTYGMGYVALSRVKTLAGLHLVGFSRDALQLDPRMHAVDAQLQERSNLAEERIKLLDQKELQQRHESFILASGGSLEKKETKTESLVTQKTHKISYDLMSQGKTLDEIAKERELSLGTIVEHLDKARQLGWDIDLAHIKPKRGDIKIIRDAFEAVRQSDESVYDTKLSPVKKYLDQAGYDYSFDEIKLVRVFL